MSTVIVAAAVVRRAGRILLTQRPQGGHLAGLWEFPGGKLEAGEAPEMALVRECREECGVEVEVVDILEVTFHRYESKDVLLLFYDCRLPFGEVRDLEVAAHLWCTPEQLRDHELPPADVGVVDKILRLDLV